MMDFKNLGNSGSMLRCGMPDTSKLGDSFGGFDKPEYVKSNEYGVRANRAFDGIEDYELPSLDIESITFHSGAILDGITVIYSDGSTVKHGGNGGGAYKIPLAGDPVKRIYGVCMSNFGVFKTVSNIYLETASGKKHGPYGSQSQGGKFEISQQGHKLVALFGSTNGNYIFSLGAYLLKL